ncbi:MULTISPECIES: hypothetical protein [unclassified Nonomuraea]
MGRHEAPPKDESPEAGAADDHREPRGGKHARDGQDAGGDD